MAVKLEARRVAIQYRRQSTGLGLVAVDGVDLRIDDGEFVSIVGPSGCGKTTFLNAVDGLIPIESGSLVLDGREIAAPGPDRAMVFQQPSLLPWRTVTGNVLYGLEMQHRAGEESRKTAAGLIDLVGLQGFADSWPSELSGGMQQRVNLARAAPPRGARAAASAGVGDAARYEPSSTTPESMLPGGCCDIRRRGPATRSAAPLRGSTPRWCARTR